jgi:glutathione S-transferase
MDFYFGRFSGNSARVAFALNEANLSFVPRFIDTMRGDPRAPAYRTIHPVGRVPAIVDGGLTLWESNAINWYLAEKHPEAGLLPPSVEGRARVQEAGASLSATPRVEAWLARMIERPAACAPATCRVIT